MIFFNFLALMPVFFFAREISYFWNSYKKVIVWLFVMMFSIITKYIDGKAAAPKINEEVIIFAPLHVYFHLSKNFPPHKTFLNSKEKFTYE